MSDMSNGQSKFGHHNLLQSALSVWLGLLVAFFVFGLAGALYIMFDPPPDIEVYSGPNHNILLAQHNKISGNVKGVSTGLLHTALANTDCATCNPFVADETSISSPTIQVTIATYGGNVGVSSGNQTAALAAACNGKTSCIYTVDYKKIGDPAPGKAKDYAATYTCGWGGPFTTSIPGEAGFGSQITLSCQVPSPFSDSTIAVINATYGGNVGVSSGNQTTNLAVACNGKIICNYTINSQTIGDPAVGKAKDYAASYKCGTDSFSVSVPGEAGFGSQITLSCQPQFDVQNPVASISTPQNGSNVFGTIPVTIVATDNVGVTSVAMFVDGVGYGATLTAAPYGIIFDTKQFGNGPHVLTVIAKDAAGNQGQSQPVTITVNNVQVVSLTPPTFSPASGSVINSGDKITIVNNVQNAVIRYTTDGSDPTQFSTLYNGPFPLNSSVTVKAVAFIDALHFSPVAAATFTVTPKVLGVGLDNKTGQVGQDFYAHVNVTDYISSYTVVIVSGSLPPGLSMQVAIPDCAQPPPGVPASCGAPSYSIVGTPTEQGSFGITLKATDSFNNTGSNTFTITIKPADATVLKAKISATVSGTSNPNGPVTNTDLNNTTPTLSVPLGTKITISWSADPVSGTTCNVYYSSPSPLGIKTQFAGGTSGSQDTGTGLLPALTKQGIWEFMVGCLNTSTSNIKVSALINVNVQPPPSDTDLEIKSVVREDSYPYLFTIQVCVFGNQSINDLKQSNPSVTAFPIRVTAYDQSGNPLNDDGNGGGTIEDLKQGACEPIGVAIQPWQQAYFEANQKVTFTLDANNWIQETNENNNSITYQGTVTQSIKVTSPAVGEHWNDSTNHTISWTDPSGTNRGDTYTVFITRQDGGAYGIAGAITEQTSLPWNVGSVLFGDQWISLPAGSYYLQVVKQYISDNITSGNIGPFYIDSAPSKPVINQFIAEPLTIGRGGSVTLKLGLSGATSANIDNGIGNVGFGSGIVTVWPTQTTTYTLTASNSVGSVTAKVTVTVDGIATPTVTVVSPRSGQNVTGGSQMQISWQSSNAPVGAVVELSYSSCQDGSCPSYWITQGLPINGDYPWMANVTEGTWYIKADLRSQPGVGSSSLATQTIPIIVFIPAHHPAGTNIRLSNGIVYFISADNQRRAYTHAGNFISYGFNDWDYVVEANAGDLVLPVGSPIPPSNGSLVRDSHGGSTVYLVTNGHLAPFTSIDVFSGLGFDFQNIIAADLSMLSVIDPISSAIERHRQGVLINNNGYAQLMGRYGRIGIPSLEVFDSWGFSWNDFVNANQTDQNLPATGNLGMRQPGEFNPEVPEVTVMQKPTNLVITIPPGTILINQNNNYSFSAQNPSGGNLSYSVGWGDGTAFVTTGGSVASGTPINQTHVYATAGNYTISFTATNSQGQSSQITKSITVMGQAISGTGLVNPGPVSISGKPGDIVKAFSLKSTTSSTFEFYGYPTNYGAGINWYPQSGGMTTGGSIDISIQINSNTPPGVYSGVGHLRNPQVFGPEETFSVAVSVTPPTPVVPAVPTSIDNIKSVDEFINYLYTCTLGRTKLASQQDPNGFTGWKNVLLQNRDFTQLYWGFYKSAEFAGRNLSDSDFLTNLYNCTLFRAPEPAGFNSWLIELGKGKPRLPADVPKNDSMVEAFVPDSNEYYNERILPKLKALLPATP